MIRYIYPEAGEYREVKQFTFPGGEVSISIPEEEGEDCEVVKVGVFANIKNSDDIMALLLTTDALRRQFPLAKLALQIPYVPYARQDRICNPGEALSIKVFATLINSLKYDAVIIADPHSAVTTALIDNVVVTSQYEIFGDIIPGLDEKFIVAPDQGALKKVEDFAKRVGAKGVVSFTKHRELSTGKITGIALNTGSEILRGENYVVLDDICDGGRTFLELVPFFDGVGLELAVTHGIFSKGVTLLTDAYDKVYTTNSFPQQVSDRLIVKEL